MLTDIFNGPFEASSSLIKRFALLGSELWKPGINIEWGSLAGYCAQGINRCFVSLEIGWLGGVLRAPGAAVMGSEDLWRLFMKAFSHSVFFSMSLTEGVFEEGGGGGTWVSSSQSSPVEMQACTFHHRVIVGWGQSTLGSQTQSSNRTQGLPCTSLENHSECTVWLNKSIVILFLSPNTSF